MKHAILILCLWLSWSSAAAQFRMIGTATWTTLTDSTYAATINFQPDLTNNGYLATQVVDGFRMFTGTEQVYTVNVNEMLSTFSSIVAVVTEYNGDHGVPIGQVMVYDPSGRATIPQAPYGNTGSTSQMQAAVDTYNARLVGTAGVDLSPYPTRAELADSTAAIRSDFPVGGAVIDSTRLTQDSILVYYQDGAEVGRDTIAGVGGGGADNLGDHTMTQNLITDGNWISGDGGNEGIGVDAAGKIGIGTLTPSYILDINSTNSAVKFPVTTSLPIGTPGLLTYSPDSTSFLGYYNAQWHRIVDRDYLSTNYWPRVGNVIIEQGNDNTSLIIGATNNLNTATANTALGQQAANAQLTGSAWTAFGYQAGRVNSSGNHWTAIGAQSAYSNTSGSRWLALGYRAGYSNTSGSDWVAMGRESGRGNVSGNSWLALGTSAGEANTSGSDWVAVGRSAAQNIASGTSFTSIGTYSAFANTSGNNWIAIGALSAYRLGDNTTSVTSFSNGIYIGYNVHPGANGASNETVIGYQATGNGSNTVTIGNNSVTDTYLRGVRLAAGTATAGTSPLKFTSGTNLTTPEAGAVEWDGTNLYITQTTGPTRKTIAYVDTDSGSTSDTTDGSGDITVSHALGSASITVTATTTGTTFYHVQVHTKTSTNFKIRFFDAAGAAVTSTAVTADWIAKLQ